MKVLTIYNCGTAYDKQVEYELVVTLAKQNSGENGADWILFAGPGSNDIVNSDYNPESNESSVVSGNSYSLEWGRKKVMGMGLGYGIKKNVRIFLELVEKLKPDVINMIGWSRGACTCHVMANKLYKYYQSSIEVNIFSIDPVPGPGLFIDNILSIPENVKNYRVILMANEVSKFFEAADVKILNSEKTKAIYLLFPGKHSTPVISGSHPAEKAVHSIVYHMADEFLTTFGTRFENRFHLSDLQLCERFSLIAYNSAHFKKFGSSVRSMGNKEKWSYLCVPGSVGPPWVNSYHAEVFTKVAQPLLNCIVLKQPQPFQYGETRKVFIPYSISNSKQFEEAMILLKSKAPMTLRFFLDNFFEFQRKEIMDKKPGFFKMSKL